MKASRINPRLLHGLDAELLQDAIDIHNSDVEKVFVLCDFGGVPHNMRIDDAVKHFGIALEIREYLCDREGLPIVSEAPNLDWYEKMAPVGHWDKMPYHRKQQEVRQIVDGIKGVDPEDTALD